MSASSITKTWQMPDAMGHRIEPLLPKYRKSRKGGWPRVPLRRVVDGIFYLLRAGCRWKAVPREFGSGSTLHGYFRAWIKQGTFRKLWKAVLLEDDKIVKSARGSCPKSQWGS